MNWTEKRFTELTPTQIHQIYRERIAVFVVEQTCPYPEVDDTDLTAWHIFNTENDELISYCRVYHAQDGAHIGRVLVAQKHRNGGKAKALMLRALTLAKREYPHENIMVQAQAHLQNFYGSLGFVPTSEVYLEDNIPHIDMILQNAA